MNKFVSVMSLLLVLSCNSSNSDNNNNDLNTEPSKSDSTLQEKLNSYSVNTSERKELMENYLELKKEFDTLELKLLAESEEDRDMYPDYVNSEDSGIIRLVKSGTFTQISGGGGYYSFPRKSHNYGQGSEIQFTGEEFSVGFAGADYGFFTILGDMNLEDVQLDVPQFQYMLSHTPSESTRTASKYYHGVDADGFNYSATVKALNGYTYAVRSIAYGRNDTLAAFQVVRRDEIDGSLIIKWKIMKKFATPEFNAN